MKKVERVTPGVWRESIVVADSSDGLRVDRIHYPPGGHTHWHLHTREQVLYGELGRGWIQFEGGHPAALTPGQVIQVPVGARHWHGAASDTSLVHLAVTAGGETVWLGEVSAEEYVGCDSVYGTDTEDPDSALGTYRRQ